VASMLRGVLGTQRVTISKAVLWRMLAIVWADSYGPA